MTESHLRAADPDRERTADRLRRAATEGRLTADELDDRLGAALTARTYGDLRALVADLPAPRVHPDRRVPAGWLRAAAVGLALAVILISLLAALRVTVVGHASAAAAQTLYLAPGHGTLSPVRIGRDH